MPFSAELLGPEQSWGQGICWARPKTTMLRKSSVNGLEVCLCKLGRGLVFKVGDPPQSPRKVGVSGSLEAGVLTVTDTHLQRAVRAAGQLQHAIVMAAPVQGLPTPQAQYWLGILASDFQPREESGGPCPSEWTPRALVRCFLPKGHFRGKGRGFVLVLGRRPLRSLTIRVS